MQGKDGGARKIGKLILRNPLASALFFAIAADLALALLIHVADPTHELGLKEYITAYAILPPFVFTVVQLVQNSALQRGNFIKDYGAQFFTAPDLFETFHELVYSFRNDEFERVDGIFREKKASGRAVDFADFQSVRNITEPGKRLYHPGMFQGSPEERRLDMLLGYLDLLGYYWDLGLIRLSDIFGTLGPFLMYMRANRAIGAYFRVIEEAWAKQHSLQQIVSQPPYAYLRKLFDALALYAADARTGEVG